jgi:hypothetical protein
MGFPSFIGAAYDEQGIPGTVRQWKNGHRPCQSGRDDRTHQPLRGPSTLSPPVMDAVLRICGKAPGCVEVRPRKPRRPCPGKASQIVRMGDFSTKRG